MKLFTPFFLAQEAQQENFDPTIALSLSDIAIGGRVPNFEADFTLNPSSTKKFKEYFLAVSQATQDASKLFEDEEILAYDSE